MTRRKFTSKFKIRVVLESLKERQTIQELAQKFDLSPSRSINGNEIFYSTLKMYLIKDLPQRRQNLRKKKNAY